MGQHSSYTVMAVDDEQDILDLYETILEGSDFRFKGFLRANDCLEFLETNVKSTVCIISDYQMPEMDGFDFRAVLEEKYPATLPFLLVTGVLSREMALKGYAYKINDFLEKPFEFETLLEKVTLHSQGRITAVNEEFEMAIGFLEESSPMLDEIEALILQIEEEPGKMTLMETYMRLLHTIKGTAACVGLPEISKFAHAYEDFIGLFKKGGRSFTEPAITILLKGLDRLREFYAQVQLDPCFIPDVEEAKKVFFEISLDQGHAVDCELEGGEGISCLGNKRGKKSQKEAQSQSQGQEAHLASEEDKISIPIQMLDYFMELSGEITVLRNSVMKSSESLARKISNDPDIERLNDSLGEMYKVSSQLQGGIVEMRKVSVSTIFRPMKRIVRDISKKLGKDVELVTKGEHLRVDTRLAKVLNNALVHLIRNAVDHGIEEPMMRLELNKSEMAQIELSLLEEGENIVVWIRDNGRGIDSEKIRSKAIEKGLHSEEDLKDYTKTRLLNLIFASGFSTAEQVTDISGRGVGMDMVRASIESVGGKILIDSVINEGTNFKIILPKPRSVLIIQALMVRLNQTIFAVPLDDVSEVLNLHEGDGTENADQRIRLLNERIFLHHHDELFPLIDIKEKLLLGKTKREDYKDLTIIVVNFNGQKIGLLFDEVYDIEDIVVKKFAKYLKPSPYFMGATLTGDSGVSLIFDIDKTANTLGIHTTLAKEEEVMKSPSAAEMVKLPEVEYLTFDLSLENNLFCLPLDKVYRLEKIDPLNIEYSGSTSLIKYYGGVLPLIDMSDFMRYELCIEGEKVRHYKEEWQASISDNLLDVIVVKEGERLFGLVVSTVCDIENTTDQIDSFMAQSECLEGTVFLHEKTTTVLNIQKTLVSYEKNKSKATVKCELLNSLVKTVAKTSDEKMAA